MHVRFIYILLILLLFLPTVSAVKSASRGDGNFNVSFSLIDSLSDYDALLGVDGNKVVDKRVYDRAILTEGHLPIAFRFAGTQGADFVVLNANKISKLFTSDKGSFFGDITNYHNSKIWFLTNESYTYVEHFYNGSIFYNQTFGNGSTLIYNQTLYGSRALTSWKYVWREVTDFNTLTLNKNQVYVIDINPKFRATTGAFAVDIIPSFSFQNNNYTLTEFGWFNSTWGNATQLVTTNNNATKAGYILANINLTWRNGMTPNMTEIRITDNTNSSEYNFWRKGCVANSFCIVDVNYTTMWAGVNSSWVWYNNDSIVTDKSNFSLTYDKANNLALDFDTTIDGFDVTAVSNSSFSRYNTTSHRLAVAATGTQEINPTATNSVYGNASFIYEFSAYVTQTGGSNFYNYILKNQTLGLGVKAATAWTYFTDGGVDSANLNIPIVVGWNDITLYNHNHSYVNFTLSVPNRTVYSQIIAWCTTGCRGVSIPPQLYRYSYVTGGSSYFDGDRLRYLLDPEPTYSFGADVVEDTTPPTVDFITPTHANATYISADYIYINVSVVDTTSDVDVALLKWDGTNESMNKLAVTASNVTFYVNKTGLSAGTYIYSVYTNDTVGNMNVSRIRTVYIDLTAPVVTISLPANTSYSSTQINLTANITESNLKNISFTNSTGSAITLINESTVLYLPLNIISGIGENSTYAVDISQYGNNGTISGATIVSGQSGFGNALSFDGVNDYASIIDSDSISPTEAITIRTWMRINSFIDNTHNEFLSKYNAYILRVNNDHEVHGFLYIDGAFREVDSNFVVSLNTSYCISLTYDNVSKDIKIYVGGDLKNNNTLSGLASYNINDAANTLYFGAQQEFSTNYFNGTLDDIKIDKRLSSASEVSALCTNQLRVHKQSSQNYTMEGNFTEPEGMRNYSIYTSDKANSTATSTRYFTVDTTIPTLTVTSPINATYANTSLVLNVYSDETISAWLYSINGTANTTFSPNTTLTVVSGSNQNLTIYANDSAGNWGTPQLLYFSIDLTAPDLSLNSPESNYNSSSSTVNFNWTSTMGNATTGVIFSNISIDDVVNVSNSVTNNGTATNYSISNIAEGAHNWSIKTWVSNSSTNTSSTYVFTVDTTVPVVENLSISPASVPEQGSVGLSVDVLETVTNISYVIIRDESLAKNHTLTLDSGNTYKITISGTSTTGIANHTLRVYANNTAGLTNNSVTGTMKVTAQAGSGGGGASSGGGGGSTTIIIEKAREVAGKFGTNLTFGANIVFFTDDWFVREYCQLLYGVPDDCTEDKFEAGTVISGSGLVYSTIATVQEESYKWQLSKLDKNNNRYVKLQDFQSPFITFVPTEEGNYSIYFEAKDTADNTFNTTHEFTVSKDFIEPSLIEKIEGGTLKGTETVTKVPRTLAESLRFKIGDFGGWLKSTFSGEELMYKFSIGDYGKYVEKSGVQFGAMIMFAMGLFFVISRVDL